MRSLTSPINWIGTGILAAALTAPVAEARDVLFDFDTDGDPSTIENEITADVGDLVVGYMVLNDFHADYNYFYGMQYGLEITDGLEVVGYWIGLGGVLNDGLDGIAVGLGGEPISREDLPVFAMHFVVRVTDASPQSVRIVPSFGWGHPLDHIQLLVSETADGAFVQIDSPITELEQIAARINGATPIEAATWSAVKRLFEDDTI